MLYFETKDGKLVKNKDEFFALLHKNGKRVIKQRRKSRSLPQNNYYWGLLGIVENETGQDVDTIHSKLKQRFLFVKGEGKELAYCRSTASLNTKEFTDYIENVKNFFAEFDIQLPSAEEYNNYFTS